MQKWLRDCLITYVTLTFYQSTRRGRIHYAHTITVALTITPILSKALEHIIWNIIKEYLCQHPLYFGFTKGMSPTMANLSVTETVADSPSIYNHYLIELQAALFTY